MIDFSLEAYRVHANNWGERCSHHYFEISPRLIQTTFQEFFCIFTVCLICTLLYVHVGGVVVSRCWNQSWVLWRTASSLSHCSIAPAPYGCIFCSCRPVYASSVLAPHIFWGGFLELGSTGFANLVPILRRVTQCPPQACFLVRFCFTQKEGDLHTCNTAQSLDVRSPHGFLVLLSIIGKSFQLSGAITAWFGPHPRSCRIQQGRLKSTSPSIGLEVEILHPSFLWDLSLGLQFVCPAEASTLASAQADWIRHPKSPKSG